MRPVASPPGAASRTSRCLVARRALIRVRRADMLLYDSNLRGLSGAYVVPSLNKGTPTPFFRARHAGPGTRHNPAGTVPRSAGTVFGSSAGIVPRDVGGVPPAQFLKVRRCTNTVFLSIQAFRHCQELSGHGQKLSGYGRKLSGSCSSIFHIN